MFIMPSPFPGMDPFIEQSPIFHELHTQILAEAQARLQPQLRPKYVARLELDQEAIQLRRQRRIVIYVKSIPRLAVASIELLSPSNKLRGSLGQTRYLEKRSSALHGGLHWIEIDLLRGGERPPVPVELPSAADYLAYVAQATPTGWNHQVYAWKLRDPLPALPIPLLGSDQAILDLATCFREAYDRTAADDEADYQTQPPAQALKADDLAWAESLLRGHGLRP